MYYSFWKKGYPCNLWIMDCEPTGSVLSTFRRGNLSRFDNFCINGDHINMATVAEQVQQLYIGLLGYAANQQDAAFWEGEINGGTNTVAGLSASLNETSDLSDLSRSEAVTELYNRMFGREPEATGLAYWTTGAGSTVPADQLALTFLSAARGNDVVTLENKAAAATTYATSAGANYTVADAKAAVDAVTPGTDGGVDGQTFTLTEGRDNFTGTADNDTFYADTGANNLGAVSNALSSGDVINGGAGYDTLNATLINDSVVDTDSNTHIPMPRLNSVEEVRVEALEDVTLDANHITDEVKYASVDSRSDLDVINVDINSTQITKDIKLEMKDTQQKSDFRVYFNEQDLKAKADEVAGSASVTIQVADGAQASTTTAPLGNMTFDLSFTQGTQTFSFQDIESTDGTYAGLVTAIEVALAEKNLTQYEVKLDGTFTSFDTGTKSIALDYTGSFITITDSEKNEFTDINFAPQQKAGSEVAILLAQSEVNAEAVTTSFVVESDITVDNVGRGSNGGEIVIGSTSSSNSSTGVERINVIVENSSVVSDISSTNDALKEITLTNGTVKGDFVLANANFDTQSYRYDNVDQATLVKEGLDKITATNFDGDIVLGRDNNLVDLGELSAAVNGDVTYNATLNDADTYKATTGAGSDTINITLDDNRIEANTDTDTAVTISTGAGNDTITVKQDTTTSEQTEATIDAGAGDDVINGNSVDVDVKAGAGNDVVYAENTGNKALLNLATSGLYTESTAATDVANANNNGTIHFLAGSKVTVTIATDSNAADALTNGYESKAIEITASKGALTTLADLNAAVLKAINEDATLSKIVTAYVDENNNVAIKYLVDGAQDAGAIELNVTSAADVTGVSTAMLNEYRDLVNDSTITGTQVVGFYNNAVAATTDTASTASHEGSTVEITTGGTGTITVMVGDETITYTGTGTLNGDATALADALVAKGFYAQANTATVSVITDKEIKVTGTGVDTTITNDVAAITSADIGMLLGSDSLVATPAVKEVTEVALVALTANQTYIFDGLTITDQGAGATAAELATVIAGGTDANLVVTGSLATTSVSVTGTTATYTANIAGDTADLTQTGTSTAAATVTTQGSDASGFTGTNTVNGNAGDDVIVLSSEDSNADTVVWTDYSQGNDTIVHFVSGVDELDFTSYLVNTVDAGAAGGSGSSSTESEVTLTRTAVSTEAFTANSINLLDFSDLDGMATGVTFENATASQIQAALNADDNNSVVASTNGIYQSKATSVLIIEDAANGSGAVTGDVQNDGTYKAYEVSYNDAAVAATTGGTAGTFTVKLIGSFDLGDDTLVTPGDFTLVS